VLRDETKDRGIGSKDGEDGGQHDEGVEHGQDAQNFRPVASGDDDAGDHAETRGDDPGAQSPGRAGQNFGKFLVGSQVVKLGFNDVDQFGYPFFRLFLADVTYHLQAVCDYNNFSFTKKSYECNLFSLAGYAAFSMT